MVSYQMTEHDTHTLFCRSRRISTDLWMNFPNHVKARLSSSVNKYINFFNWFNSAKFLYWLHILSNRPWRSSELHSHSIIKWNSSSTVLHMEHSLWWAGVFGFVYLPRSISNEWELVRNLAIDVRYLKFFYFIQIWFCSIPGFDQIVCF